MKGKENIDMLEVVKIDISMYVKIMRPITSNRYFIEFHEMW